MEGVRLLLERGLTPDLRDDAGHTPMDLAAGVRVLMGRDGMGLIGCRRAYMAWDDDDCCAWALS